MFSCLTVAAGLLGVAFQAQALVLAIYYAEHLSSGKMLFFRMLELICYWTSGPRWNCLWPLGKYSCFATLFCSGHYISRWGEARLMRGIMRCVHGEFSSCYQGRPCQGLKPMTAPQVKRGSIFGCFVGKPVRGGCFGSGGKIDFATIVVHGFWGSTEYP